MSKHPIVKQHPNGIYQIDADYIAPGVACVYLINQNSRLALIETGTVNTVPHVLKVIEDLGLTPEHLDYVIPTHVHLDHAAGAGAILKQCPNARLVIHPRGAPHMINPEKIEAGTRAVYGDKQYERLYGSLIPVAAERVIEAPDNTSIELNGRTLTFLDTPGHARHHFCVHDTGSNSFFTGDTAGISYRHFDNPTAGDDKPGASNIFWFVTTTPVQFDPQAMGQSIKRLLSFNPDYLYLTHYGPVKPNEAHVTQLLNSLEVFTAIAEAERAAPKGRADRMAENIMEWMISQLQQSNSTVPESVARQWLATDAKLNAQGMEAWLQRS